MMKELQELSIGLHETINGYYDHKISIILIDENKKPFAEIIMTEKRTKQLIHSLQETLYELAILKDDNT